MMYYKINIEYFFFLFKLLIFYKVSQIFLDLISSLFFIPPNIGPPAYIIYYFLNCINFNFNLKSILSHHISFTYLN